MKVPRQINEEDFEKVKHLIRDPKELIKFYAQITNSADDELNLREYRLNGHYRTVCGATYDHRCVESEEATYTKCEMGYVKFKETRQALIDKGYIRIAEQGTPNMPGVKGKAAVIECCNLWLRNYVRYAKPSELLDEIKAILFGNDAEADGLVLENGINSSDRGLKPSEQRGIALQPEVPKELNNLKTKDKKRTATPSSALPISGLNGKNGDVKSPGTGSERALPSAPDDGSPLEGSDPKSKMELEEACTFSQRVAALMKLDGWTVSWEQLAHKRRRFVDAGGASREYPSPVELYNQYDTFKEFVTWYVEYRMNAARDKNFKLGAKKVIDEIRNYRRERTGWFEWYTDNNKNSQSVFADPNRKETSPAKIFVVPVDVKDLEGIVEIDKYDKYR
jgi:hypothetical protein